MSGPTATIAGVNAPIEPATLNITDRVRERSIARFTVQDAAGASEYKRGDSITILDSAAAVLYRGFVWNDEITRLVSTGETRHFVVATDNTYLVDKRIIAAAYSAQTARAIITDLINDVFYQEKVAAWTHQWLELTGASEYAISDADPATTDLAVIVGIRAADYTPAAAQTIAGHWLVTGNQRSWEIRLDTAGTLTFAYTTDGSTVVTRTSTATLASAIAGLTDNATDVWVKVTLDADNGAAGHAVKFWWSTSHPANPNEATPTDWTQLGATVTTAGAITLHNSTSFLTVGGHASGGTDFNGRIYRAEFYTDHAATTLVADPSFDQLPEWDTGDVASTDDVGNTWTLKPTATEPAIDRTYTIDVGPTLTIVFNYVTGYQALDDLAERAQFWWNVDNDKILRFHARTTNAAPFAVDETNILVGTDTISNDHPNYRNTQYIRGGFDQTTSQVEVFAGDGERITFSVGFPVASVPTVESNIAAGGYTAKTVGIRGLDTGKDFYWNKGANEIVQDAGGTVLNTADLLRVTYIGLIDLVVKSLDNTQVVEQAAREGGSGIVEAVLDDPNIEGRAAAFDAASDKLAQFGNTLARAKFAVETAGLAPGQLVDTTLPKHGIPANTDLLIEEVTLDHRGADKYRYTVTAAEGPPQRSWTEFFRVMAEQAGRVPAENISGVTTVTLLETVSESVALSENLTATVYACPVPAVGLFPDVTTLFPC